MDFCVIYKKKKKRKKEKEGLRSYGFFQIKIIKENGKTGDGVVLQAKDTKRCVSGGHLFSVL